MQKQQVLITHTQGAVTQNLMHTNLTADQSYHISNQHRSCNEQRYNQGKILLLNQQDNQLLSKDNLEFSTQYFQQTKNL